MKKSFLLFTFIFCLWNCSGITPFYLQMFNQNGTPQTNAVTMQSWPPDANNFTVNGTNIINGGIITYQPSTNGYFSNALFANLYAVKIPASGFSFFANLPDTTNFLSLALYATNLNAYSGVSLSAFGVITNLLGFTPANVANIGTIARRGSNEFALATSLGTIAGRASNEFALVTSLGTIAGRGSNEFALATADGLSLSISNLTNVKVMTNGATTVVSYKTNAAPGSVFTNLPPGSLMMTTNGGLFRLTNSAWQPIAL